MKKLIRILRINLLKTFWVNYSSLPISQAIRLPIIVNYGSIVRGAGKISFACPVKFGLLRIGSRSAEIVDVCYERTLFINRGQIIINGTVWIGAGCRVIVSEGGVLKMGENLKITGRTSLICKKCINIGRDCLFSWDIQIMDSDFHKIYDNKNFVINKNSTIKIGDHVWIGARSTILKGAEIPSNSIVAAGSLYVGIREEQNCIYGGSGNSLRVLKKGVEWSDM